MSSDRSRQLGIAVMVAAVLQVLLFLLGASRRSYTALALPVFLGVAAVSGLTAWIGYTMATAHWDDDYEDDELPTAAPEPAEAVTP